jgi:arsenical pump membrane protein
MSPEAIVTYAVAIAATLGVLFRPGRLPEYFFALVGGAALVIAGLLPWPDAVSAILKGGDVYLFLTGMMLLSELARHEGLFDWTAVHAVRAARGSQPRLFALIYGVGTIVTIFLSNDATAVVLTPAVYAATRAARVDPLPYLYICAFIANAASFVLPISNPANLVVFGANMPPLAQWIATFLAPSIVAIVVTYAVLHLTQRRALVGPIPAEPEDCPLSLPGKIAGVGLLATALVLLVASARGLDLGIPTFLCGTGVSAFVLLAARRSPVAIMRDVSWGVLPLVAGLFVLVEGLAHVGGIDAIAAPLRTVAAIAPRETAVVAGLISGLASNVFNNLPTGLVAAAASHAAAAPTMVTAGLLIGVDLGPNLSVTGSLATLLWLIAIRREGVRLSALRFLRLGALVTPPALVLSLLALAAF